MRELIIFFTVGVLLFATVRGFGVMSQAKADRYRAATGIYLDEQEEKAEIRIDRARRTTEVLITSIKVGFGLLAAGALTFITSFGVDIWKRAKAPSIIPVGEDMTVVIWGGKPLLIDRLTGSSQPLMLGKKESMTRADMKRLEYLVREAAKTNQGQEWIGAGVVQSIKGDK